ncbi:hypothetical protein FRB94_010297 [Tulasnella sp. JGI-2019a]|nr:hypothetical protein FRB93_009274 [Tulasnella sp. JGI-2019a]KAG8993890.1 hypothetical protein FRB94_010297 [Tulasnella sp. JGI-2019a]KAG9027239.1 hypothetical protein FRB95_007956 [Tulasnella sp. JGI-2019a]
MSNSASQLALYYLGPEGTYTHQAGYNLFHTQVRYTPISTITGLFDALATAPSESTALAIAPIENSQHGAVIETLDALQLPVVGKNIFIRGEHGFPISHSLVVRAGTKREDLRIVASHPQALGQCTRYLKQHLSQAATRETTSTAAASRLVLEDSTGQTAAICSKLCVELYAGLELLEENIQDSDTNATRFILLSKSLNRPLPTMAFMSDVPIQVRIPDRRAAFRFNYPTGADHLPCLSSKYKLMRIDRRPELHSALPTQWITSPSPPANPFRDVYLVTVGEKQGLHPSDSEEGWRQSLIDTLTARQEERNDAGSITLVGAW